MTRTSDVVVAFMAAHGNAALRGGAPIPYARHQNVQPSWFWRAGEEPTRFETWATRGGVERFGIIHPTRVLASPPALYQSRERALSVTRELSGGSNLVFVARRGDADDVYLVTQADTSRVSLEDADVIAFVEQDTASASLKELWLQCNVREQLSSEPSWESFACAARGSREHLLVDVANRVFAGVSVTDETRRAWYALVRARTPEPVIAYDFRFAARCEPLALVTDRDAARLALGGALDDAVVFAEQSALAGWANTFRTARSALDGPPNSGIGWTFFEGALAPEAQRLLDAAWEADVFAGMGSWNDIELPPGHEKIGAALQAALKAAIEAAINGV